MIRQTHRAGGVLAAEVCILDDINRAPGEALNVLLRILNEHRFGGMHLPLRTAIATGNPAGEDRYYNEALDPASLDRFTLQVRHAGLLEGGRWIEAGGVIDMYEGVPLAGTGDAVALGLTPAEREAAAEALAAAPRLLPAVVVTASTKRVLLHVLRALVEEYSLDESNSLLSDRTFLVNSVKCMQAAALLAGRAVTEPADVHVLRFLTTFRVPPPVHSQIARIVQAAIDEEAAADDEPRDGGSATGTPPDKAGADDPNQPEVEQSLAADPRPPEDAGSQTARADGLDGTDSWPQQLAADGSAGAGSAPQRQPEPTEGGARPALAEDLRARAERKDGSGGDDNALIMDARLQHLRAESAHDDVLALARDVRSRLPSLSVQGVDSLARALGGQIQHCRFAALGRHSGGAPRRQVRAAGLSDLVGGHRTVCAAGDVARWLDQPSPRFPVALRRERRWDAGEVSSIRRNEPLGKRGVMA